MKSLKNKRKRKKERHSKAVLREKCIALNAYIRKEEKSRVSNISSHLKDLDKRKGKIYSKQAEGRKYKDKDKNQ